MKYVVTNEFLDRFDNMRHCKLGEPHVPPTEDRAAHLLDLGFIEVVEEQKDKNEESNQKQSEKAARGKKANVSAKDDGHGAEAESK